MGTFTVYKERKHKGNTYTFRRIMRVTERNIDNNGQMLLISEVEVEGWWTTLESADAEVIALYRDHATSEQFHSEFKTDMDLERLPSGKFDSNDLVLNLGALTYNILKHIGLCGLLDEDAPVRHSAKRRRIKTVIQELMYVAARLIKRSRQLWLRFG
ncbi:transposase [Candidatus Venteria ishoeyi]|uniref:transposase n=1 Tax=Candidatus Venteria ishoeyi TaxID=1899563 RepID=UPI000CDEC147|nr:transposase [Candidatus Venteria ishoeyi]